MIPFTPLPKEPNMSPKDESQVFILRNEEPPSKIRRRQDCSLLTQWTFSYFQDYLKIGNQRELKSEDFPEVEDFDKAQTMAESIHREWIAEQELHGEKANFARALWRVFGYRYMVAGVFFFVEFIIQLTQGWFLSRLLSSIADGSQSKYTYWYAAGLVFDQASYTFIHHWEWWITIRTGMQLRIGLIAAIYKKITNLSLANVSSTGFIVNLVSNDVQRFEDAAPFLHYCWITPLQIIGYMTLIYYEIGWSMFAAVGCIGLIVPMQYCFGRFFKKYRRITVDFRDERIKCISDMIAGIQIVKLYAWEIPFMKKINEWRDAEMKYIWKGSFLKAINESIFFSSGVIINALTFVLYHYLGGELTPAKIFSTIVYLNVLKLSITNFIPKSFQFVSECVVSLERLRKFFSLPEAEIERCASSLSEFSDVAVALKNASFSWKKDDNGVQTLQNITMSIKKGELVMICGVVGAGKSSLLHAILGDMFLMNGESHLNQKKIAYVPQTPWILSGSIKDNILFGLPYDDQKFKNSVHVAALEKDLELFPKGALTFIGERGITLSGGQRARISLARAVYSDAEMFLLDDPLSAVDTKVGRFLFEQCISTALKGKTVFLVTHQLQFLSGADKIMVFEGGHVVQFGTYHEIVESGSSFAESVRLYSKQQKDDNLMRNDVGEENSVNFMDHDDEGDFIKEEVFKGSVTFNTYYRYFMEGISKPFAIILPILLLSSQTFGVLADFWLSNWSSLSDQSSTIYPIVLSSLAVATLLFSILRAIIFFMVSFYSSRNSFRKMMHHVFGASMDFFQSNPNGRIMNRFSKDINLMDETLPQVFFDFVQCTILTIAVFVVAAIIIPYALILFPFIAYLLIKLRNYYMNASRQIKRIEAISRSPVYSTIPSTLEGLSVVRAFNAKERFNSEFFGHQDNNTRMFFGFVSSGRWLGMRLDGMVAILSAIIIFSVLALQSTLGISSVSIGLLISYLIQMTGTLQWTVRQSSEVENLMVSVERVLEYTEIDPEENLRRGTSLPTVPPDWPQNGKVSLNDASLRYPDFQNPGQFGPPVLKNISITLDAGTKVGIVGRTGAGKSSLLQALFRLVEPSPKGCISIDSISTSDLPLSTLRSRISIIPQEPFCFKGTLRFNLDPFNQFSDEDLWKVLEATELKATVSKAVGKLDAVVEENGANWSIGERQLICLARAILRNSKLLVMDEATSSIDLHTDQLLQKTIRSLFKNATVLTIAHRLNSVIDFDRILVLDQGKIVEFGSPKELLLKDSNLPDAWFSKMVSEMGDAARQELIHLAK